MQRDDDWMPTHYLILSGSDLSVRISSVSTNEYICIRHLRVPPYLQSVHTVSSLHASPSGPWCYWIYMISSSPICLVLVYILPLLTVESDGVMRSVALHGQGMPRDVCSFRAVDERLCNDTLEIYLLHFVSLSSPTSLYPNSLIMIASLKMSTNLHQVAIGSAPIQRLPSLSDSDSYSPRVTGIIRGQGLAETLRQAR